ncbi:ferrous iron transport protein B [Mariprofundus erugo]|uniref:Ferrous iron transport protein B n=1 Tax=Mariprofundus erugo TaxID=2528639 RepID=A0A5R9GR91_9PROT|nr:ferrous iron transport protein B [Mariprofundus erugo]TLS66943.1 ferrous iron transport protein B [Mariprofundus erugo]
MPQVFDTTHPLTFHRRLYRGDSRLRVALVGQHNSGKSTIFQAVASTHYRTGKLSGTNKSYAECPVQIGADEMHLVELPALHSLRGLTGADLEAMKYLLWGDERPLVSRHEQHDPPAPFPRPDILIHVIDASVLGRSLELTLELLELGLPVVVALNMMDEARRKGVVIDVEALSARLGIPVIPTVALKGHGLATLFDQVLSTARQAICPLPQPIGLPLQPWLQQMRHILYGSDACAEHTRTAFNLPADFLLMQLLEQDPYLGREVASHCPDLLPAIEALHKTAASELSRPLATEVEADRHQRAISMFESVATIMHRPATTTEERLDMFFLHPRWGLFGSLAVFAAILFLVFEVSATLDALSAARLATWISAWQPETATGIIGRAVADGLIGLIGIVIPYMLPLVLMLVLLEETGIMQRIAFVVDRFFHAVGLHGKVAVPFLLGLGCNVPAIAATRSLCHGRDRVIASLLITFVPCSARSAVVLALGAKYLGAAGVFALFLLNLLIIALLGRLLSHRYPELSPGIIQEIPAYAWPRWHPLLAGTWQRTSDILTIVTPLLVAGSIILALMQFAGMDQWINTLLTPVTGWMLGLPVAMGVPILFGVLRKELSLAMIYQALGTFEITPLLDHIQITTFLVFLLFYIPCVSTFAVMLKVIGRKEALFSIILSIGVALIAATCVRMLLTLSSPLF